MEVWRTRLSTNSDEFRAKYAAMSKLIEQLEKEKEKCLVCPHWLLEECTDVMKQFQGEEKYIMRAQKSGKLLARERYFLRLHKHKYKHHIESCHM